MLARELVHHDLGLYLWRLPAGVGRAMLEAAIAWCEENPRLLKLGLSVYEDNARAVALYLSLGFVEEGHRPGEYRERDGSLRGDILMYRDVGKT